MKMSDRNKQPARLGRYANLGQVKSTKRPPRQHKHFLWFWRLSRPKKAMVILLPILAVLITVPILSYFYYARDIGDQERLMNRNNTGIVLTDAAGKTIYSVGNAERRQLVQLSEISKDMQHALLASEDKDFYKHSGFNPVSILRAAVTRHGGGSTLTQQLVKNTLLTSEQTFMRKYQELFMAIAVEQNYTKEQILTMYLNSVYFGENAFGIGEAAKVYFGKSAKDLTLAESSMLVGLLPAPSDYSPISGSAELAKRRQKIVLGRMVQEKYITADQQKEAAAQTLSYAGGSAEQTNSEAPHFAQMVIEQLKKKYGGANGSYDKVMRAGYRVKTSLNADAQRILEQNITKQMKSINRLGGTNASGIVIDPSSGEVRALVGSADYKNAEWGKVNMATALRQPGSTFKPIYYSQALADGVITPATIFEDKQTDFNGYTPHNALRRWYGNVSTRKALSWSLNIPSVLVMKKYGISRSIEGARKLGLTSLDESKNYGLSLALGSAEARLTEMTNAYAAFANNGVQSTSLNFITEVKDKYNKNMRWQRATTRQAISAGGAYLISSILSDNAARSGMFGSSLTIPGKTVAVKTGTTNDNRDAWTIGYTQQYAVGIWVGNNNNAVMNSGGSDVAAPIWRGAMTQLLSGQSNTGFTPPSEVTERNVCRSNGGLADSSSAGVYKEYFLSAALPTERCNQQKSKIQVCNLSEKKIESIYEDDFDESKYSKDTNNCKQKETKQIKVCDLSSRSVITIPEDQFDSSKYSRNTTNCRKNNNVGGDDNGNTGGDNDGDSSSGNTGNNPTLPVTPSLPRGDTNRSRTN